MTLIFSNKNRILFTRENADQLLELSYSNRFIPLFDVVTSNLEKRNKISFKNFGTNVLCNLFDVYKTKNPKSNYYYKSSILASTSHKICNKQKRFKEEGHQYRYKPTNLQFAPMHIRTLHKSKICEVSSAHRRFIRNYDSSLYKPWFCKENQPLESSLTDKSLYSNAKEVATFGLKLNPLSHIERAEASAFGFSLQRKKALALIQNKTQKPSLQKKIFLQDSQISNSHANTTLLDSKGVCTVHVRADFKANHYLFLKGLLKQDLLVKTLKKAGGIKVLLPKINLWSFAFGSSFLFLIMTSILQRQEQNSGCSSFFKRQIPGFSTGYQESSWECFENITSKYINRSFDHNVRYAKKTDFTINPCLSLLGTRHECANVLGTSVQNKVKKFSIANQSTFVPTCHLECDETAAKKMYNLNFSLYKFGTFVSAKLIPSTRHERANVPSICSLKLKKISTCKAEIKNINFSKNQLYIDFSEPWNLQSHKNFTAVFSKMIARNVPSKQSKLSLQSTNVPNQWIVKPVYQMHAQIPFFHSYPHKPYNLDSTNSNKPRLSFKERLFLENNTIPSKMSCSTNTIFADNYKIRNSSALQIYDLYFSEQIRHSESASLKRTCERDSASPFFSESASLRAEIKKGRFVPNLCAEIHKLKFKSPLFLSSEYSRPRLTECIGLKKRSIDKREPKLTDEGKGNPSAQVQTTQDARTLHKSLICEVPSAERQAKNIKDTQCTFARYTNQRFVKRRVPTIERKNDIVKKFFYEYGFFSIPTKAALIEQNFQDLAVPGTLVPNQLTYIKERTLHKSKICEVPNFLSLLSDLNFGENLASPYKGDLSTNDASPSKGDLCTFVPTPLYELNRPINTSIERVSSYLLSKTKTIGPRLMSGYKSAEVNNMLTSRKDRVFIKIPPALPFYKTKFSSFLRGSYDFSIDSDRKSYTQNHPVTLQKNCTLDPITKEHLINSLKTRQYKSPYKSKICTCKALGTSQIQHSESASLKGTCECNSASPKKDLCNVQMNSTLGTRHECANVRTGEGAMPYRQLSLKEFQEIKPLFEKVNKEMRVSPYKLTFKEPLFIDYNDYLSRPKDSLAAISISPSLEEDKTIHQLWDEHVEKDLLLNQSVENQLGKESKPVDKSKKEAHTNSARTYLDEQPSLVDSQIDNLFKNKKESELLSAENKSNSGVELYQENEEKEFNEEEKKKEITKWEWLQNVRESELEIEKRKDFQKFAYPKKEALVTKSLDQVKKYPHFEFQHNLSINDESRRLRRSRLRRKMEGDSCKTPAFKNIQTFLVGDRKYSFFGITNLFPKRLIAEDQRQINNQILREDYDQRKVDSVKFLNKENANRRCQEKEFSSIEDLYAAKAFAPLRSALPWSCKQDLPLNTSSTQKTFEKRQGKNEARSFRNQEGISILRIAPRNKDFHNFKVANLNLGVNKKSYDYTYRINRQHPVYTPNRRLRLRLRDNSKSSQNSTPQSRIDSLNLCQSHRWWQKRRLTSNLLGSPSKRYMVMPEIEKEDWKRIIEWQLKTYFIEEEKRLQPLITSLGSSDIFGSSEKIDIDTFARSWRAPSSRVPNKQSGNFKIKKIAVYLPWLTIKKSLKKPFEWPLTRLSYQSQELLNSTPRKRDLLLQFPQNCDCVSSVKNKRLVNKKNRLANLSKNKISINDVSLDNDILQPDFSKLAFCTNQRGRKGYTRNNKKPDYCLVSSLSPQFKTLDLSSFKLPLEQNDSRHIRSNSGPPEIQSSKISNKSLSTKDVQRGLHEFVLTNPKFVSKVSAKIKENDSKTKIYKPFIFEAITKDSHLLFHQLLLAIAIKQIFQKIYHLFGKIIINRIKNSSLGIALLPLFFNVYYRENQISEPYRLKKRLKDIVGSEDTISSLSEIVWYLRNSCRGRAVPRGVVLVETHDSESTEFLKAVGGEAKVPVIVQSLRALPLTQNHPQRRLEKILKLAEKRAPCILFLDDLDAIGKARTLLLKGKKDSGRTTQSFDQLPDVSQNRYNLSISNEKTKWKGLKDSSLINVSSRASFTKHVRGRSYASPSSTQKNSTTRLPFFDGSTLDTKVQMCQEKIRLSVQEESSFYRLTKQKQSTFARYTNQRFVKCLVPNPNMLLFSANSTRKSDSQRAHAFLLNSFLSSSKFYKRTTPTFSNSAHSNGSFSFSPIVQNGISFPETICKRKFTSNVPKTNINFSGADSEDSDLLSNDKMLEQRRLDLMLRLLTVMDGISHLKGVLIVTTSKNPSSLDPALLRPGRFERFINLKLPNKKRRIELLRIHTSKIGYTNPMPWEYLGAETENMNGTEITNAINHSAFKAIIQSTVHTLSTLEYGIKRVNSEAFTNLPFLAKAGSATRIQRGGNKNLECPESRSFKLIDKLADQPCKISFASSARECSFKFKKSKLSSYNLARYTNQRFVKCRGTKKNTLLLGAGLVNKTHIKNASGDASPFQGGLSINDASFIDRSRTNSALGTSQIKDLCNVRICQRFVRKHDASLMMSKNLQAEQRKVRLINTPYNCSIDKRQNQSTFVPNFQHKNFTFVRSLHVRAESQFSFYQAGKGVVQALLFSHSAHSEFLNSIRRSKEKNIQFNSSFVPRHYKSPYKSKICTCKALQKFGTNVIRLRRKKICVTCERAQYLSLMKRGIHPKGSFPFYKRQGKKALLSKRGSKICTGNLILVDFAEDFINLYAGRASESLYLNSIIRKICKSEESLTNTIIRKICKAAKTFPSTSRNLTSAI